jgi:lysyl-tRNA synthetase class 2
VAANGTTVVRDGEREVDLAPPWPRIRLAEAIEERSGIDPMADRDPDRIRAYLLERGVSAAAKDATWGQLVDRLLSHYVEPQITDPVFLIDYPFEISPLARQREDDPSLVERFEAFALGMEFANGYSELNDPDVQAQRFAEQVAERAAGDEEAAPADDDYVEALAYGLPPTAGVGVGIDRLVMLLSGKRSIRDVVLFPALRS